MKKSAFIRRISLLAALAVAIFAVSCDGGSPTGAASSASPSGSGASSSSELNQDASIRVWFTMNTAENEVLTQIAQKFEEETGVSVEVLDSNFFSMRQKFPNAAQSSEKPDLVYIQSADLGFLAQNGYLRPVTWLNPSITDRFYDIAFDSLRYNGEYYGAGYSIDAYGIVYNKDLIASIPETWSEYFAKAKEMTQHSGSEITFYGTQVAVNNYWFIYPLIKNEGGYYFGQKEDGSYDPSDIGLDSAGTAAALQKLLELKKTGLTTQAYTELDSDISARFADGKVAMFIYGLWDAAAYQSKGIRYGFAPLPNHDGGENKSGARNTCSKAVMASDYVQSSEVLKSLNAVSLTGEVFPTNAEAGVIWNYSTTVLNAIFFKDASVEGKLKEFADQVKADIATMQG